MSPDQTAGGAREIEGEAEAQTGNVTGGPGIQADDIEHPVTKKTEEPADNRMDTARRTVSAGTSDR